MLASLYLLIVPITLKSSPKPKTLNPHRCLKLSLVDTQVEETALKKEKDPVSKARLEEARQELATLQEQLHPLLMRYRSEKSRLDEINVLRKKREDYMVRAPPSPPLPGPRPWLVGGARVIHHQRHRITARTALVSAF